MRRGLRIGEVAGKVGVNVQTLRYYERRGILSEPGRAVSGYREYSADSVPRVRFIKRAQALGFTLTEVHQLLQLRDDPGIPCKHVRATAEAKILEIDEKLRRLKAVRSALGSLVASCAANRKHHCPLLEALDDANGRAARTRRPKRGNP